MAFVQGPNLLGQLGAPPGTWRDRYGSPDPSAAGPLAPYLANPAAFKVAFDPRGAFWLVLPDTSGNVWFVLYKGPNGEAYDWPNIAKRNPSGYQPVLATFQDAEATNAHLLGVDFDRHVGITLQTVRDQNLIERTELHTVRWKLPFEYDGDVAVIRNTWPMNFEDLGRADKVPESYTAGRVALDFVLETKNGKIPFRAVGNPAVRIAMITGFPGNVIGGDTWVESAIMTLVYIVEAVVGIYTGNYGLAVSATMQTIQMWSAYAAGFAAAAEGASDKGDKLGRQNQVGGRAQGHGVQVPPGGPQIRDGINPPGGQPGAPSAQQPQQQGGGLVLAAIAAWLLFG